MNSVIVICAPRRAALAPDRNVTQTISSSADSVTAARSLPKTCSTTLANTRRIITAPISTTVQSTSAPNAASRGGAGGDLGNIGRAGAAGRNPAAALARADALSRFIAAPRASDGGRA